MLPLDFGIATNQSYYLNSRSHERLNQFTMSVKAMALLGATILFHTTLLGQFTDSCSVTLKGKVIDEHDQSELSYSTIYIAELGVGTTADSTGYYELMGLCPGTYSLIISHIGCKSTEEIITIRSNTTKNFYLEHHTELLEIVTVKGIRTDHPTTQEKIVLDKLTLDRTSGSDLAHSLEQISGVQMLQTGPTIAKPIIHGLHSNRILILNNGIRQEGQQWGNDHAPEIDPFVADRISVIKGAAAVRYGSDAIGGVILIEPETLPTTAEIHGETYLIGISNGRQGIASAELQGGLKNWKGFGWRVNSTYKRGGDLKAPAYNLTNTGLQEVDFSAAAGWRTEEKGLNLFYSRFQSELGILRSAHIGNLTDFELALKSERPLYIKDFSYRIENPKQSVRHDLVKLDGFWQLPRLGKVQAMYAFQFNNRQEFDIRRGGRSDIPALDLNLATHTLDVLLDHRLLFDKLKGTAGLHYKYQQNRNVSGTGIQPLIPWYNNYNAGIFLTERWIENNWALEAGLRYDYQFLQTKNFNSQNELDIAERNFHNWAISLGGLWRASEGMQFRTNISTAFRPPNVSELYSNGLHHSVASYEIGSPDLQTERAVKWISTATISTSKRLFLEASIYENYIQNYIYARPGSEPILTIRGAFPVYKYTQTDVNIWGLDGLARLQLLPPLSLEVKGAIVRGRDLNRKEHLIYLPADRLEATLSFEPKQNFGLNSLRFFATGLQVWEQSRVPEEDIDFLPPPDAYFLLHTGVSSMLPIGKQQFSVQLSVRNVLNTSYREYLNRLRYYADEPGRSVEVRLKYSF